MLTEYLDAICAFADTTEKEIERMTKDIVCIADFFMMHSCV
jgi:hypothetical protein